MDRVVSLERSSASDHIRFVSSAPSPSLPPLLLQMFRKCRHQCIACGHREIIATKPCVSARGYDLHVQGGEMMAMMPIRHDHIVGLAHLHDDGPSGTTIQQGRQGSLTSMMMPIRFDHTVGHAHLHDALE